MSLTRADVRALRDRLEAALAGFGDDVQVTVGSATYSPNNATFKVELAAVGEDGEAVTKEAEDFQRYCRIYGLRPEDLNREFEYGGTRYKLIGCKPRSTKFPLLAENVGSGKVYKLPAAVVQLALQAGEAVATAQATEPEEG